MEVVSAEVDKILKCAIYNSVFFLSGGGVDDVLVRLSLIKKIIKDVNLMLISFSVKHPSVNEFVHYVQNYFKYLYIPI